MRQKRETLFDKQSFASDCTASMINEEVEPDKKVKKLLLKLLDIYMEVFDPKNFSEEELQIKNKDAIRPIKEKLLALRKKEFDKIEMANISLHHIADSPAAEQDFETIKRCFWINLLNYKILQKILEIFLVRPRVLRKTLTNCTMFMILMTSTKVVV